MSSASKRRFWHFSPKSSTFEPCTRATVDVPGASVAPAAWVDRNEPSFRRFAVYGPPNTANSAQNADFGMPLHAHRRDHRFLLGSGPFPPRGSVPARAAFHPPRPYLPTGALKLKFTTRPTYLSTRVTCTTRLQLTKVRITGAAGHGPVAPFTGLLHLLGSALHAALHLVEGRTPP